MLATPVARADSLVASIDYQHAWWVHSIAAGKVKKLQAGTDAVAMAFSDAHTLWVLRVVKGKPAIVRIADAKAQTERKLDLDGLQNAFAPVLFLGSLIAATDGSVWLMGCRPSDKAAGSSQCKRLYLRVDNDTFTIANTHPRAIDSFARAPTPMTDEPRGHHAQITGELYSCNNRKLPYVGRSATSLAWLSGRPPILRVALKAGCDGDVAELDLGDLVDCKSEPVAYVLDCTTYVDDVRALPDDVLAITKDSKSWQLYRGGKVVGTIPGGAELMVAPN